MANVEIYTTARCPFCEYAKQLLKHKGVEFQEYRVDDNPEKFQEMMTRSQGRRSVPQIFINNEGIGGFDELKALDQDGSLDQKLL